MSDLREQVETKHFGQERIRNMPIPRIKLSPDQKIWISEMINSYLNNESPDEAVIYRRCLNKISSDFNPHLIDARMIYCGEINVFGIYCLNKKHKLLSSLNRIIKYIKESFPKQKIEPRTVTAEELQRKLKIPLQEIRVCLKLIGHDPRYTDGDSGCYDNTFGYSHIIVKTRDTIQRYLQYQTLRTFIEAMLDYRESFEKIEKDIPAPIQQKSTARVGYSVKGYNVRQQVFIHRQIQKEGFTKLIKGNPRGPKKRADIPRISNFSDRRPEQVEPPLQDYELRTDWIPQDVSNKTVYRVLNLSLHAALSLIDYLSENCLK